MAIIYYPTEDAYINAYYADTTYNTYPQYFGQAYGIEERTLVKFGMVIPTGKYFVYGDLYVDGWGIGGITEGTYRLRSCEGSWDETTVTWNNHPAGSKIADRSTQHVQYQIYKFVDIPDDIGFYLNYGIIIGSAGNNILSQIDSREYSAYTPYLSIQVTEPTTLNSVTQANPDVAEVTASWATCNEPYFAAYNVWRGDTAGGPYTDLVATVWGSPSYETFAQTNGTKKYYKIQTVYYSHGTLKGHDLTITNEVAGVSKKRPQNLSATGQNKQASLSWTTVGADKYYIYHSTNGVSYDKLGDEPTGGNYVHTGLTASNHYYKISAYYNATGVGESAQTVAQMCTVTCNPPANLDATGGNRQANLTWSACSPAPVSYYIYRSSNGTDYTKLATEPTSPSFSDTDLKSGTYWYKVLAHYSDENSGYSNIQSCVVTCAAPTGLAAYTSDTDNLGIIKLGGTGGSFATPGQWNQCSPTPVEYKVYRATSQFGTYSYMGSVTTSARTYTDSNLPNGTFWYKITALYSDEESAFSSVVSATVIDSQDMFIEFTEGYAMVNGELLYIPSGTQALVSDFTEGSGDYYIYVKPGNELGSYYTDEEKFALRVTKDTTPETNELAICSVSFDGVSVLSNLQNINREINSISNIGTSENPFWTGKGIYFASGEDLHLEGDIIFIGEAHHIYAASGKDIEVHLGDHDGANYFVIRDDYGTGGTRVFQVDSDGFIEGRSDEPVILRNKTAVTDAREGVTILRATSTGDMVDGFGSQLQFAIEDGAANNTIGWIAAIRDGADNSGKMSFAVYQAGSVKRWLDVENTRDIKFILGDTAGATKFYIQDSALATQASIDSDGNLTLAGDATIGGGDVFGPSGANLHIVAQSGYDVILRCGGTGANDLIAFQNSSTTEVGKIDGAGNLQIDGDLTVDGGDIKLPAGGGINWNSSAATLYEMSASLFATGGNLVISNGTVMPLGIGETSAGVYARIYDAGYGYALWRATSSSQSKENIREFDGNAKDLLNVQIRKFTDKVSQEDVVGFIAEEMIAEGFTAPVSFNRDGIPMGINDPVLIAYLVELCKLQQQEIDNLRVDVNTLLGR